MSGLAELLMARCSTHAVWGMPAVHVVHAIVEVGVTL
jgi:hypothetical protein